MFFKKLYNRITGKVVNKIEDLYGYPVYHIGESAKGSYFSTDKALTLTAVWACIRLLAGSIGTLPLVVYEKKENGDKEVANDHPLYSLLHYCPAAGYTSGLWLEAVETHLCTHGNFYGHKIYGSDSKYPLAVYPLEPEYMKVEIENYTKTYTYTANGETKVIQEKDIVHIPGSFYDGIVGLSPISAHARTLGLALSTENTADQMFENGVMPSGILSTEQPIIKPEQRQQLRDSLKEQVGGVKKGGIMVLEAGMKYQAMSLSPADAQILESRNFTIEEICRIFYGIPPHMIAHTSKVTSYGTGIGQQNIGFLRYVLQPDLTRIQQNVTMQLLPRDEWDRYVIEFNNKAFLRADSTSQAGYYSSALQNGWLSRNEVRKLENMPSIPGGDTYTAQVNLLPVDELGENNEAESNQD